MHLAHCLKASVTSPRWPFFPPNSGIWILLEIHLSFSIYPRWRWRIERNENCLSSPHFCYLYFPSSFFLSCERRSRSDLHLKLLHLQRSADKDPSWVGALSYRGGGRAMGEERLGLDPLSAPVGSLVIPAGPGIGLAIWGWNGTAAIEIPEGWCREVSCC